MCSGMAVLASRIPTMCVGMGCFCDDFGVLMLSHETESSILGFCIIPFGMLVIALTLWLQPQISVLPNTQHEDERFLRCLFPQHASLG